MIFNTLPQDYDSRCSTLEKIIVFLDVKSISNFLASSAVRQYDGNGVLRFCNQIMHEHKDKAIKNLNRKYYRDYPQCTPHIVACEKGNIDDLRRFVLLGVDVNGCGKNRTGWAGGYNPLLTATRYERLEIVEYLLTFCDIDVNATTNNGMSALHTAAYHSSDSRITSVLLKHPKILVNLQNDRGWTALDWALEYNSKNESLCKLLRQSGGRRKQELHGETME